MPGPWLHAQATLRCQVNSDPNHPPPQQDQPVWGVGTGQRMETVFSQSQQGFGAVSREPRAQEETGAFAFLRGLGARSAGAGSVTTRQRPANAGRRGGGQRGRGLLAGWGQRSRLTCGGTGGTGQTCQGHLGRLTWRGVASALQGLQPDAVGAPPSHPNLLRRPPYLAL